MEDTDNDWPSVSCGNTPERIRHGHLLNDDDDTPHESTIYLAPGSSSPSTSAAVLQTTPQSATTHATGTTTIVLPENWFLSPSGLTPDECRYPRPQTIDVKIGYAKKGRKSLLSKFPMIQPIADTFIKQNGFEAHKKRNGEGTCGSRVDDVRDHVNINIDKLLMSSSATSRLFLPPNKSFKASKNYKGVIKAKVARKRNKVRRLDDDEHPYSCRVKLLRQYGAWFHEDCAVISCDNKNKVNVGVLAVSRFTHITRIFHIDDAPNYPDHDFPNPDSKIIPMGYMLLPPAPSPVVWTEPILKREQIEFPKAGPIHIINRSAKFHGNTMAEHAKDLIALKILFQGKYVLILISDNGPDWTTRSMMNLVYLFEIWEDLELDALIIVSYCPYHSALNPIEHGWSPCTKAITAVTLEDKLPDEITRPAAQNLDPETLWRKETTILDTAMMDLCNYFNKASTEDYAIASTFKRCRDSSEKQISERHQQLKIDMSSVAKIKGNPPLHRKIQQMVEHLDRRWDAAIIKRCRSKECEICTKIRRPPSPALKFLYAHRDFPNANPSREFPDHFSTFRDYLRGSVKASVVPDTHIDRVRSLRSALQTPVRCGKCQYTYTSKADKNKHMKLFHTS